MDFPDLKPDQPPTIDGRTVLSYRRKKSFPEILKGKPVEDEECLDCAGTRDGGADLCSVVP